MEWIRFGAESQIHLCRPQVTIVTIATIAGGSTPWQWQSGVTSRPTHLSESRHLSGQSVGLKLGLLDCRARDVTSDRLRRLSSTRFTKQFFPVQRARSTAEQPFEKTRFRWFWQFLCRCEESSDHIRDDITKWWRNREFRQLWRRRHIHAVTVGAEAYCAGDSADEDKKKDTTWVASEDTSEDLEWLNKRC